MKRSNKISDRYSDRVSLKGGFGYVALIGAIGSEEFAVISSEPWLGHPRSKIRHPGTASEFYIAEVADSGSYRGKYCPQNPWAGRVEIGPQAVFAIATFRRENAKSNRNGSIREIRPAS
jgi:hypothetical protein